MPQKPKITYAEPADRPFSMDLSLGELHALAKHHEKQANTVEKSAIKAIGEWQLKDKPSKRDLDAIKKQAETMINAHLLRARGFAAILNSHFDFEADRTSKQKP